MPKVGFKHSIETIQKLRDSKKGKPSPLTLEQRKQKSIQYTGAGNPNYGKKYSAEVREKISLAAKRQWENPITRKNALDGLKKRSENPEWKLNLSHRKSEIGRLNIAISNRERASNPEIRKKMSESQKKRLQNKENHPNFGKKMSEEQKKKLSIAKKGKKLPPFTEEHKRRIGESEKGKIVSEITKKKIRGELNSQWKGGLTSLYLQIRNCAKYYEWRKNVFERDNYCDQFSGIKGNGNLNAHHIVPFNLLLSKHHITTIEDAMKCDELWDINNGITLLKTSHEAYHQTWGVIK